MPKGSKFSSNAKLRSFRKSHPRQPRGGQEPGHLGGSPGPLVNAGNNFWGAADGQTHPSNPGGTGDSYVGNVDADPFLTGSPISAPCLGGGNQPPDPPVDIDSAINEVDEGAANGTTVGVTALANDPDGDTPTYILTDDAGGRFTVNSASGVVTVANGTSLDGPDSHSITVQASDPSNATSIAVFTIYVNNVAPTIVSITVPLDPGAITDQSSFSVDVSFTDPAGVNDELYTCDFDLDNNGTIDAPLGGVTGSFCSTPLNYALPGVYTVKVTVTDKDGGSDMATATQFIAIYDPAAGFVTGAGWIDSPLGAFAADSTLTGRANFGFVSKYKKGRTIPTGNTRFKFKAGDLNFDSSSYEWMVIAGAKAMYKGVGTINNAGNFGFQLSAIDAALTPSTNEDLFRIRIFDKDNNHALVYDNKVGETDPNADSTTALSGGAIKIHQNN